MNNTGITILIALMLSLHACSGGADQSSDGQTADSSSLPVELQQGVMTLDLSAYYLPFSLIVPDSTKGYPEVEDTGYGEYIVRVGDNYQVVIAEGGDLQEKKAALADDLLFDHEIIEEGSDYILYKSTIKDSFLDPVYHFYAVKQVGGLQFEFHDYDAEDGYAESVATFMLKSVNNLIPKEPAG
ncbi:MAG: hypothetical protein Kow0075_06230 [Salibacteraceae bacterium]